MKIEDKIIDHISIRSLCTIILMIGAFFVVHGFLKRLADGGYLLECLLGIVVSVIAIIIAAIPSKKSDFSLSERKSQEKR